MGGHVRMDKDLEDDGRVLDLAEKLVLMQPGLSSELARNAVLGGMYRLWRYADTHLRRYNRLPAALHGPARLANVTGLPALLIQAFPTDWLVLHQDGSYELPGYREKNCLIDKDERREKTRERVRKWRAKQRDRSSNGNAGNSVTEKALQRYERVTTGSGPVTETGTGTSETGTGTQDGAPAPLPAEAGCGAPEESSTERVLRELANAPLLTDAHIARIHGVETRTVTALRRRRLP